MISKVNEKKQPCILANNKSKTVSYETGKNTKQNSNSKANPRNKLNHLETTNVAKPPNKSEIDFTIQWLSNLGLPALPVAPKQPLEGDKPDLTGKEPSTFNKRGKPRRIRHKEFQSRLPTQKELKQFFKNPNVGIGTIAGNGITFIDLDRKNYDSQEECDRDAKSLLAKIGQATWTERTGSGGWRIAIKLKEGAKVFKNFTLDPKKNRHRGEILGKGTFTVLAPTTHPNGRRYSSIGYHPPAQISSLQSIGIYTHDAGGKRVQTPPTNPHPTVENKSVGGGGVSPDGVRDTADIFDNNFDGQLLLELLTYLDPNMPRESWIKVGMILKSINSDLLPTWIEWSKKSYKFKTGECERTWSTFREQGSYTMASLIYMAKKEGYKPDGYYFRDSSSSSCLKDEVTLKSTIIDKNSNKLYLIGDNFDSEVIAKDKLINTLQISRECIGNTAIAINEILKNNKKIKEIILIPQPGDANNRDRLLRFKKIIYKLEKLVCAKILVLDYFQYLPDSLNIAEISLSQLAIEERFIKASFWVEANLHYIGVYSQEKKLSFDDTRIRVERINREKIGEVEFSEGLNIIKSPLGTGKTHSLIEWILKQLTSNPKRKFHLIGGRNYLLRNTISRINSRAGNPIVSHLQDLIKDRNISRVNDEKNKSCLGESLSYCFHSGHHILPDDFDDNVVIIDEAESVRRYFVNDGNIKDYHHTSFVFNAALKRAKYVILLDGQFSNDSLNFYRELAGYSRPVKFILNEYKLPPRKAILLDNKMKLTEAFLNSNRGFLTTTAKTYSQEIYQLLDKKLNSILVNGDNSGEEGSLTFAEDPVTYIKKNDISHSIISYSLASGFDCNLKDYFDAVFAYVDGINHSIDDNLQSLMRLRDLDVPRIIYYDEFPRLDDVNINSRNIQEEQISRTESLLQQYQGYSSIPFEEINSIYSDIFYRTFRKEKLYSILEKRYHQIFFIRRLIDAGYHLTRSMNDSVEDLESVKNKSKEVKEKIYRDTAHRLIELEEKGAYVDENAPQTEENSKINILKKVRKELPNFVKSESWNDDFLVSHYLKNRNLISQVRLRFAVQHFKENQLIESKNSEDKIQRLSDNEYVAFHKDWYSKFFDIQAFQEIGILQFIVKLSDGIPRLPGDKIFTDFASICKKNKKKIKLKYEKDRIRSINDILSRLGYKLIRVDSEEKGKKLKKYKLEDCHDSEEIKDLVLDIKTSVELSHKKRLAWKDLTLQPIVVWDSVEQKFKEQLKDLSYTLGSNESYQHDKLEKLSELEEFLAKKLQLNWDSVIAWMREKMPGIKSEEIDSFENINNLSILQIQAIRSNILPSIAADPEAKKRTVEPENTPPTNARVLYSGMWFGGGCGDSDTVGDSAEKNVKNLILKYLENNRDNSDICVVLLAGELEIKGGIPITKKYLRDLESNGLILMRKSRDFEQISLI